MMPKLLAWAKAHLVIVIALPLGIIGLAAMLFFSARWNAQIRKTTSDEVSKYLSQLNGLKVEYTIPKVLPEQEEWSVRQEPTEIFTNSVGELLQRITRESDAVLQAAIAHNRAGKTPIVEGLFPTPAGEVASARLRSEVISAWPRAHHDLLADHRIGMPSPSDQLLERIRLSQQRERDRIVGGRVDQELSPEELQSIEERLSQERIALYRREAENLTAYGEVGAFASVQPWPSGELPSLETAWEWQHALWIHQDLIDAIFKANLDGYGNAAPVFAAPVKRLLSVAIAPQERSGAGRGEEPAVIPDSLNTRIEPDYSKWHTGHLAWPERPNPFYDIRYATIDLLVDANRLPALLNAISSTNFMTVVDMDLAAYDQFEDLPLGFIYGDDPVVRATLTIETIWLRRWIKDYMPASVRTKLGIPEDPPPAEQPADADGLQDPV